MKKTKKTYSWNRNAATHRSAVTRFAIMAYFLSFSSPVGIIIATTPWRNIDTDTVRWVAIALVFSQAFTFMFTFAIMCAFYHLLNESQVDNKSPHPTGKWLKKSAPVYTKGHDKPKYYIESWRRE